MLRTLNRIEQIRELQKRYSPFCNSGMACLYRGQSNFQWEITTTLQRIITDLGNKKYIWNKYVENYNKFKDVAIRYGYDRLKLSSQNEDFYYMSMARHLGMPSHFLDWTASFETALEMACNSSEENEEIDGAIFVMSIPKEEHIYSIYNIDIWNDTILVCKDFDLVCSEKGFSSMPLGRLRRLRQNGYFSIINISDFELNFEELLSLHSMKLDKIRIPANKKREFFEHMRNNRPNNYLELGSQENNEIDQKLISIINDLKNSINSK